jgi:hypothetical protein
VLQETLLTLAQAAKRFPSDSRTGHLDPATLWRWATRGVRLPDGRRLKLETFKLAGRFLTSEQAIERFVRAQNDDSPGSPVPDSKPGPKPSSKSKKKESRAEEAGRRLAEMGA